MNCSKCGTLNASNAKFCSSCGTRLESAEAAATVDPAAPPYAAPYAEDGSPAQPIPPMAPPMGAPAKTPPPPPQYNGAPGQAPPPPYNPAPPLVKPYKAEFVMGLIGSIVGCIIFLVMLISGITLIGLSYGFGYMYNYATGVGAASIVGSILVLVAFILGFVGTSKVNRGDGKGGVLLTVGGGLGLLAFLIAILSTGWTGIFYFPLLLTAGIMALARRKKVEGR